MDIGFVGMAAALGLSAAGSAFGAGFAGMSSVGAWKKCYASGKPAPFIMIAFSGAPLTQTIYGFLLMNARRDRKRYRELLHRHRYRRNGGSVHTGLRTAAAEQLSIPLFGNARIKRTASAVLLFFLKNIRLCGNP